MKKISLITIVVNLFVCDLFAQDSQEKNNYFVQSKGYSSNPDSDPPAYVYQLDQTGIDDFKEIDWIDAGLNYRMRFESRKNDFRRSTDNTDNPFLSRTQAYFGIKNIIDPLRFALELQDSRRYNSKFSKSASDVNELDIFQAYGELYFKNPILLDRPFSIRFGKMSYELMDRKLFSRDEWGNTGTNFQGFRNIIGTKKDEWQLDSFVLNPIIEKPETRDRKNDGQHFYGTVFNWRKWSKSITLQPFYFALDQRKSANSQEMHIRSPGLRFYGEFKNIDIDYDFIGTYQFGDNNRQSHNAKAYAGEIGYSLQNNWKTRASLVYGYASGDKNPYDNKNQRFERFYGFNRPWSNSNHIEWENLETVKSRIEFRPHKNLRLESSYSFYWLASATDSWKRANLQDKSGNNGKEIGQDFDFRAHYQISKNIKTTLGYAHFIPGNFARKVGRTQSSDFIYLETTFNIFGT